MDPGGIGGSEGWSWGGKGWKKLGRAGKGWEKLEKGWEGSPEPAAAPQIPRCPRGIKTEIRTGIRTGTIRVLPELKQLGRAHVNNGLEMIDFTLGKNGFIAAKVS